MEKKIATCLLQERQSKSETESTKWNFYWQGSTDKEYCLLSNTYDKAQHHQKKKKRRKTHTHA